MSQAAKQNVAIAVIGFCVPLMFCGAVLSAAGGPGRPALFILAFATTVLLCGLEYLRRSPG